MIQIVGSDAHSINDGKGYELVSYTINVPDPYEPPKVTIKSVTALGKGEGPENKYKYTIKYTIDKGTDDIKSTRAVIYNAAGTTEICTINLNNTSTSGTRTSTFKVSDTYTTNGTKYKVNVRVNDGTNKVEASNKKTIYTYTEPVIEGGVIVTPDNYINARTGIGFDIGGLNQAKWAEQGENEFKTHIKVNIENDWIDHEGTRGGSKDVWRSISNTNHYGLNEEHTRMLFPDTHDAEEVTVTFSRYSSSSDWRSNLVSTKVVVFYRPRIPVGEPEFRQNSVSGNKLLTTNNKVLENNSSLSSIFIKWTYADEEAKSGYVQGYRVRLYYDSPSGGKKLYKTYFTTNKYQEIKKDEIPRIYNTSIDITPYYKHNETNTDNYWYGTETVSADFFTLLSQLSTPAIQYPVNGTTWHNKDFRVCFRLPVDPDMDWLKANEPSAANSYTYDNLEFKIGSKVYRLNNATGYTSGSTLDTSIFSTTSLTYQKPIVVYPNKDVSSTSSSYTLQIRVKKKLGTTNTNTYWTSFSTATTVYVSHPTYSVQVNDIILATHYNTLYDMIYKMNNVYGVVWSNAPNKAVAKSTIITAEQYSYNTLLKTVNAIKSKVNTYATYDSNKSNIKFDNSNSLASSQSSFNPTAGVKITADYSQNYIKWVYEQCDYMK